MVTLQYATMKFSCSHLLLFISLSFFFLFPHCALAQSIKLSDKISFSVNNVTVSDALEDLTRVTGNAFSYNPDQLPATKLIRVNIHNQPLIEVLNAILGAPGFGYRQMGNQIIIYRNKEENTPQESESENTGKKPIENERNKPVPENVTANLKPDTIIREVHDTLKLTEYVIKRDTIYEKVVSPVAGNEIFSKTADLSKELTPVWKYTFGVTASYYIPFSAYSASSIYSEKIAQYKDSYSNSVFSGSAGGELLASYKKIAASIGIGVTSFSEKLNYSYLKESGGFFRKDTLDKYYTLSNSDTTWYYILDSAYVPKDNELFNYKLNNHVKYLEVPVSVHYRFPSGKMLFFIKAGLIAGINIGADGQQIKVEGEGILPVRNLNFKPFVLSYNVGTGAAIPINRKFILTTSFSWRNHLSSIYKDFPIDVRYGAFGINAALSYKLY